MPTLLESLGAPPQSVVPTSVIEPVAPLPAPAAPADEFAAFEDAAPADEFDAFEDAPPDEFAAFPDADDLDTLTVEELAANRDKFNPKEYYANHPELFSDPKRAAKFLDVYRIRDKEGLDAVQVAKAAATETIPTVGKLLGGVRDVAEGAINVGLQPVANVFGGILTGDIFNKQRREELIAETKREQKRGVAQFAAGSEASATGIADLGRQAVRKLASDPDRSPFAIGLAGSGVSEEQVTGKPALKKTDQELLQQLASDEEFGKQLGDIVQGKGETAKAIGLDADTLAKEGITLDPEVIERLSLVDPLTIIAGGGVFKGVTAAGKTVFTAATREAAEATIQRITQVATRAAAAPIRGIGKGVELAGTASKKVAPLAPAVGTVSGALSGGLSGAGAGYFAGLGAQRGLRVGGALLEKGGRGIAAAGEAVGNSRILQQALRGGAEGAVATAPLAAATDDDLAAGTLLGAGIGLGGGIRGAIATAEAPALAIARSRLAPKNIVYPETKSPGYRRDRVLDAAHEESIKTLPAPQQNEINSFRETARKLGAEVYFLDDASYAVGVQDSAARSLGRELTGQEKVDLGRVADSEGYFDTSVEGKRVLYLRKSADAATHEVGHLFKNLLAPERQAELTQAVRDSYTPAQIEEVRVDQSRRLGEEKSTEYAINEIAADNFSQVFRNTPVSELTAPPGLLQEIRRNVTDFAENLGLDLTAGERTANVGAQSSLRFNDVVRDAAREILLPKPVQPVVTPKPKPKTITLAEAGRELGPLVEPRIVKQTPPAVAPRGATPEVEAPKDVVDEARKIADEAPDTTLPEAAQSQKAILNTVADAIAGKEGVRYNYRNAPDVPGAAEEASRAPRRAEIEKARNMPEDLRRMTETTGIPYRVVKSSGGVVQVLDWAPDMLASNALRVAKALSELAAKDPKNPVLQKIKYGLDVQKGEWTEQGWRDIFTDAETFSANQGKGFTGSGLSLEFPPDVVAAGRTAPAETGVPVPLDQGVADFQNLLYNIRVPKTPRQGAKLAGNIVSQKISEATLPGRLREPALVEPRKASETGVRKPFKSGEEILDPNPLRAEFEKALQAQSIPLPDGIEVVRRLNLEHIADVVSEPNLPRTVGGVTPVLEAGFAAPKPKEISAMGAEDFDAATKAFKGKYGGGLTGMAAELGAGVKDAAGLAELQAGLVDSQNKIAAARATRDIDTMFAETGKAQFFREAVETATGTGPSEGFIQKIFDPEFKSPLKETTGQFAAPRGLEQVETVGDDYASSAGLKVTHSTGFKLYNRDVGKRLAAAFDKAKHEPNNPEVRSSYGALKRELLDQYEAIVDAGYDLEPVDAVESPYANAGDVVKDLKDNKHMAFNLTESVFGNSEADRIGNLMLENSGVELKGVKLSYNDLFRAVHDFFGHGRTGGSFGPQGEFNTWREHASLFSKEAQGALATETIGQTAWMNLNPRLLNEGGKLIRPGEEGFVKRQQRPWADQKNFVMPEDIVQRALDYGEVVPAEAQFAAPKKKAEDKYAFKPGTPGGFSKAWIMPGGEPVQLGGAWHHQWLSENPDVVAKYKLEVPPFEGGDSEGVREGALKAGFGRINYSKNNGTLTVEARAKDWRRIKGAVERIVESNLDNIDNMTVHLLDESAVKTVDSQTARFFNFDDAEKLQHLPFITEGEVRGQFAAPKVEGELGLEIPQDARRAQKALRAQVAESREKYPEAVPLDIRKEEDGSYKIDAKGKPVYIETPYGLDATPLAKEAAKGKRGDEAKDSAIDRAYADKIKEAYEIAKKNPEIAAGANWYSLARTKLKALFGEDTKFFTELLGATSAQTDVPTNFRYAIEAYNNFKTGKYDAQIQKYQEGKAIWEQRDMGLEEGETPFAQVLEELGLPSDTTSAAFREVWIDKHNLKPTKNNKALFGANSDAVLRVLDGSWREEVQGPKTPNFADNLLGTSFEATIDIWAARLLHRLGNEGSTKRWRILPKNEDAVSNPDFYRGQRAFRLAGDELGISPDSLQAIMWFAEKDVWDKSGWTKKAGAEKSDFNAFLDVTTRGYSERLKGPGSLTIDEAALKKSEPKKEKPQLDFDLGME